MKRIAAILLFCFLLSACGGSGIERISQVKLSVECDITETYDIAFSYDPADSDITNEDVRLSSEDPNIATVEFTSAENGYIKGLVTPHSVGRTQITCSVDGLARNTPIKITDRAAEEEEARKAAEEKAAKQAAEEEAARKAAEEEAAKQAAAEEAKQASAENTETVYITPSGKRWHRSSSCGGKNSYAVDITKVGGRTPCKKCAS